MRLSILLLASLLAAPAGANFGAVSALFPRTGPNDCEWHLKSTRVLGAWQRLAAAGIAPGEGVLIAQPDTGFTPHPELPLAVGRGGIVLADSYDFVHNVGNGYDDLQAREDGVLAVPGHGVQPMSVLVSPRGSPLDDVSATSSGCYVSGVAPAAEVLPIKFTHGVIVLAPKRLALAIDHAVASGAHIISIAQGTPLPDDDLWRAVREANEAGVIIVTAAGNGTPFVIFPAAFPETIAVAGTGPDDRPFLFSSMGRQVDISAPGAKVYAAWSTRDLTTGEPFSDVRASYGTTLASAQVAGIAALWLSFHGAEAVRARYGARTSVVFRQLLAQSARTPSDWRTDLYGAGLVDADALLTLPLPD